MMYVSKMNLIKFILAVITSVFVLSSCAKKGVDDYYYYAGLYGSGTTNNGGCNNCCCNNGCNGGGDSVCTSLITILNDKEMVISGATIELYGPINGTYTTDSNGEVYFEDLESGRYIIKIEKELYKTNTYMFEVEGGHCPILYIGLEEISDPDTETCSTSFIVEDENGPISGASIAITDVDGSPFSTNIEGQAIITGLEAGSYFYTVTKDGYVDYSGLYNNSTLACNIQTILISSQPLCAEGTWSITGHVPNEGSCSACPTLEEHGALIAENSDDGTSCVCELGYEWSDDACVPMDPDVTFASDQFNQYRDVAIDSEGRIVVAGGQGQSSPNGYLYPGAANYVVRYDPDDLSFDTSFNGSGKVSRSLDTSGYGYSNWANSLVIQNVNGEEKIVFGGKSMQGVITFARLNEDGSFDSSYATVGYESINLTNYDEDTMSLVSQPDNKVLMVGKGLYGGFYVGQVNSTWLRLQEDGSIDTSSFISPTGWTHLHAYGYHPLHPTGSNPEQYQAYDEATDVKIIEEGGQYKSISVGYTSLGWYYQGNWYSDYPEYTANSKQIYLLKRNQNGSIDTSFGPYLGVTNGASRLIAGFSFMTSFNNFETSSRLAVDTEGRILVVGTTFSEGSNKMFVARFTANGILDVTFGDDGITTIQVGADAFGSDIAIDSYGRIVVAGFSHQIGAGSTRNYSGNGSYSGQPYNFTVARLKVDGSLDTSFHDIGYTVTDNQPAGDYIVKGLAVHPTNGNYYVCGYHIYLDVDSNYYMEAILAKYQP